MVARLKGKKTKNSLKKDKKKGPSSQVEAKAKPKGLAKTTAHPDVPDNIDDILAEFRGHIGTSKEDRVGQKEREIDEYLEQYQQEGGQGSLATQSDVPDTIDDLLEELEGPVSGGTTIESSARDSEASSQPEVQDNIDDILAEFNAPASEVPTVPAAQESQQTTSPNMTEKVDDMIAEFHSSASRETSESSPHDSQEAPASIDDILAEFGAPASEAPTASSAQELQNASGLAARGESRG